MILEGDTLRMDGRRRLAMAREITRRELRWEALRLVCALPTLRVTVAYARQMVQRGGCQSGYPKAVGIMVGGEVHMCVVAEGRLIGNG